MGYLNILVSAQSEIPIETEPNSSPDYSAFAVFIFIVIIVAVIWKLTHRTKKRRYFKADVKREVLKDQNYNCAICKRSTGVWDYDHIDGNRSNNDISNCQALCPNCHAKKQGDYWNRRSRLSVGL
jgi:HNH endonuclease